MQPTYEFGAQTHLVTPVREGDGLLIDVDGHSQRVRLIWRDRHEYVLTVNGRPRTAYVAQDDNALFVHLDGRVWTLRSRDEFANAGADTTNADRVALAPMPGVVVEIAVAVGQHVNAGDTLLLIESMKLQSEIKAKSSGIVSRVAVAPGASFERNAVLIEIADEGNAQ